MQSAPPPSSPSSPLDPERRNNNKPALPSPPRRKKKSGIWCRFQSQPPLLPQLLQALGGQLIQFQTSNQLFIFSLLVNWVRRWPGAGGGGQALSFHSQFSTACEVTGPTSETRLLPPTVFRCLGVEGPALDEARTCCYSGGALARGVKRHHTTWPSKHAVAPKIAARRLLLAFLERSTICGDGAGKQVAPEKTPENLD